MTASEVRNSVGQSGADGLEWLEMIPPTLLSSNSSLYAYAHYSDDLSRMIKRVEEVLNKLDGVSPPPSEEHIEEMFTRSRKLYQRVTLGGLTPPLRSALIALDLSNEPLNAILAQHIEGQLSQASATLERMGRIWKGFCLTRPEYGKERAAEFTMLPLESLLDTPSDGMQLSRSVLDISREGFPPVMGFQAPLDKLASLVQEGEALKALLPVKHEILDGIITTCEKALAPLSGWNVTPEAKVVGTSVATNLAHSFIDERKEVARAFALLNTPQEIELLNDLKALRNTLDHLLSIGLVTFDRAREILTQGPKAQKRWVLLSKELRLKQLTLAQKIEDARTTINSLYFKSTSTSSLFNFERYWFMFDSYNKSDKALCPLNLDKIPVSEEEYEGDDR